VQNTNSNLKVRYFPVDFDANLEQKMYDSELVGG
jgi:hypothetical protein